MSETETALLPAPDPAQLLAAGIEHYKAGALPEAIAAWREVLELAPDSAEAWHMLGIAAGDCGDGPMSIELIRQASELTPGEMRYHNNLANALRAAGDLPGARASFERALSLAPESVEVLTNLGVTLEDAGDRDSAIALFRRAITIKPHFADAHFTLGNALRAQGNLVAAEQAFRRAVAFKPEYVEAQFNLAIVLEVQGNLPAAEERFQKVIALRPGAAEAHRALAGLQHRMGRLDDAVQSYIHALRLDPERPDTYYDLGVALQAQGQVPAAIESYRQALLRQPSLTDALVNLGVLEHGEGRFAEAERTLRAALAIAPDLVEAHVNLGNTLLEQDNYRGAVAEYARAIEIDPAHAEAHSNLGNVLHDLGDAPGALAAHRQALALKPDLPEAHWNYALTLLCQGQLREGWDEHEWRWKKAGFPSKRLTLDLPFWQGESLQGKRIVVWAEQGVGDELMFAGCIPDLVERGARVVLACTAKLKPLFQRSFPAVEVVEDRSLAGTDARIEADYQLPIGSLPRFLRGNLSDFPTRSSYLHPDTAKVQHYRDRLAVLGGGIKVGISWRSKLMTVERRKFYSRLMEWLPILRIPGVTFINLQYDECEAELAEAATATGISIGQARDVDLFNDMDDVAALCGALDLVLAPDSSVGEIAAAVGTEVWRLDAGIDWSTLGTPHRPWQPNMKLFRKQPGGDWAPVIEAVAAALAYRASGGLQLLRSAS